MIELEHVSKSYNVGARRYDVLNDVSMVFPTGVSIGVLGLNGAGKSTLLRLIGGTEPADAGTIRKDVRVSWPIGYGGGVHPALTGRENARFISRIYGEPAHKVEQFAAEFTELGAFFDMPVKTYSTGMRARLAFAVSMVCEFDCYLVDEITSAGDKRFSLRYREAFKQRLKNASMVLVSHNPHTIREFCSRAAILHAGKLELFKNVETALSAYNNHVFEPKDE